MFATPIPRETLLHVVKSLPASPHILVQLGHLLLDPNSDMDEVIKLLRCDTALTARIIRISNSAFYSTGQRNASLEEALARVGFNEVYRLTGLAALAQLADPDLTAYGITGAQLRENSLLTALVAEALAAHTAIDPKHAYTAGLLRSIGKIALDGVMRAGSKPAVATLSPGDNLLDWETRAVGLHNGEAAATILAEWRFASHTIDGIRSHYRPLPSSPALASLLNLAAAAADRGGHGLPGETSYWDVTPEKLSAVGVSEEEVENATRLALIQFGPLRAALR